MRWKLIYVARRLVLAALDRLKYYYKQTNKETHEEPPQFANIRMLLCKTTHHLHNISVDALDAISCAAPCGLQTLEETFIGIRPSEALIQRSLPQVLAKSLQSFEPVDATLSFYPSGNPKLKCTPTSRNRIYLSSVEKGRRRSRV